MPRRPAKPIDFAIPPVDGYVLYRLYDAAGELLYVGATYQLLSSRIRAHARTKAWWSEVKSCTAEVTSGPDEMRHLEWQAITSERPRYNVRTSKPNVSLPFRPAPVFLGRKSSEGLTPDERIFFMTGETAS